MTAPRQQPTRHTGTRRLAQGVGKALPPMPVTLLLLAFTLPAEASISLGSLRLSAYRIILIVLLFPALGRLMQNRRVPPAAPDVLICLHGLWAAMALIVTMGLGEGIETAGIYFIETFGGYLVARAYITTPDRFAAVVRLIFIVTATLLAFAVMESLSGVHILREPFKAVFGGPGPHKIEPRLGLTRAFTSFEHPILFGVFAASAFSSTYYVLCGGLLNGKTIKKVMVVVGATFFSLSSGPFVALAFQMGLVGWDRITRGVANRWTILLSMFAGAWMVLTLLSNRSPVLVFISYMTFSASSAYNRVHIWTYGSAEVARHPLFGIGLNDWIRAPWMSASMDNYWLITTMRYGIPAFVFLVLTVVLVARAQAGARRRDPFVKNCAKAWLVTFMGFALAGLTVHFWNALMVQFFFLIGCGMALTKVPATARPGQRGIAPTPINGAHAPANATPPRIHPQPKGQPSWA